MCRLTWLHLWEFVPGLRRFISMQVNFIFSYIENFQYCSKRFCWLAFWTYGNEYQYLSVLLEDWQEYRKTNNEIVFICNQLSCCRSFFMNVANKKRHISIWKQLICNLEDEMHTEYCVAYLFFHTNGHDVCFSENVGLQKMQVSSSRLFDKFSQY